MSHGYDDTYTVYNEVPFTARKSHECDACKQTIARGHRYTRVFTLFAGDTDTIKRCGRCQTLHLHLRSRCFGYDNLWPDERLNCGEDYRENWGEEPPLPIQELAFLLPGEQPGRLLPGAPGIGETE